MSSQMPTTGERSRTYWTPPMERYFIDLMLDQMHRGNKIGHTFNKQAWTDMLTWFNAKFGSQYDKDVLKGRYTNLWKQFNDVKILLGQNGFAWDETRQMVSADDFVWDSYIKAHPDARSYKTKTLLNYNDLYVIFGYATADGRYSRSSHDVDNDDELLAVKIGEGRGTQGFTTNEHKRTDWTPPMDLYFIDLMLDQLQRGNKINHTFNKQAWTDMVIAFNENFNSQYGKRVLRHRYKKLWKYCNDITVLLEQSGFYWDELQHKVTADHDIWDAYIKAHPHVRSYRTRTFPNYKDLCLIYGNEITGGRCSNSDQEKYLEDDAVLVKTDGRERERESEAPTSTDRSRTYWTPPMDRYFIELLLEQVNAGNKIGHTFITQAWVHMITSFNEKFGVQHDKDVLKNRYKHLRRQYKDITALLEQSTFSWDETRQMVMADDHVWDAYIKDHPDARSYRIKTVPNYNSLCLIYGKETTDGRYSRLAHATDNDNDFSGLKFEGNDAEAIADSDCLSTDWTQPMYHYFIELMLEQVQRGNKIGNTFNEQAWTHMITSFNVKFTYQYGKDAFESRYDILRKQYNDIMVVLEQSGFLGDPQETIIADKNHWNAFIQAGPDVLAYRTIILEKFRDLSIIYGNRAFCGGDSNSMQHVDVDRYKLERENGGGSLGSELSVMSDSPRDPSNDVQDSSGGKMDSSDQKKKRRSLMQATSQSSCKVQRTGEGSIDALSEMSDMLTSLHNGKENKNFAPIENVIIELQALPDIDDELLLDACDLLEDEKKAKTFLALDVSLKKKWLLRKLRPQKSPSVPGSA